VDKKKKKKTWQNFANRLKDNISFPIRKDRFVSVSATAAATTSTTLQKTPDF